jgi:hypothetical protein
VSEQRGWPYEPVDTRAAAPVAVAEPPVALSVRDPHAEPEAPPPQPDRPRALLALVVVATVAVLLGGFAVIDWFSRNQELDTLLDRIEVAERAQLLPRDSIDLLRRECYFSPGDCDSTAIARVASRFLPDLQTTGDAVAKTRLTRHHGALRDMRDRYVEHNLAWQRWLSALSRAPLDTDPPSDITPTFQAAGRAARKAVPPFAIHNARARVDLLFTLT